MERYGPALQRLAYVYLKNIHDAEDAVQDVFLAYLRSTAVFSAEEQRRAWLMTVTANRCRSLLRSPRRQTEPLSEELACLPAEESDLLRAVLALEEKYRLPIHLYYYEGYSIAEIAALLHRSAATVGSQLARGREKLRKMLEEE
ncbi:MAG: sigma-70 family RNA polymerase sigma factor [Oscillospiraceae bacterium]|nr:sigma-70 family RNA polymerase sigma factor [Oscillospiraceae bacterium]